MNGFRAKRSTGLDEVAHDCFGRRGAAPAQSLCFRNRGNLKAWPLSGRPDGSQLSEPSDPGPVSELFATLARSYPGPDTYGP